MFGNNDKITLTLINAKNIAGEILPFQLSLPLTDDNYTIPDDLVSIDVFEYHEGLVNGGKTAFSIYIGEVTTINNLINSNTMLDVKIAKNIIIKSIDNSICIQDRLDKKVILANINENDIVVNNKEELISVIQNLSNNLSIIRNSVLKIKTLSNKNIN